MSDEEIADLYIDAVVTASKAVLELDSVVTKLLDASLVLESPRDAALIAGTMTTLASAESLLQSFLQSVAR